LPATKETKQAEVQVVAPAFFETMRIPLLAGRGVEWSDRQGAPRVAVVNEAFAKSILSNTKPIGERLGCGEPSRQIEVIGVVGDAKYSGLRTAAPPTVYLPIRQQPLRELTFAVRTTGDPAVAATASRTVLGQLDANIPMYDVASQIDVIAHAIGRERLLTRLLATFGLLALLLACIGIYATLAHVVAQRTRDIGVRIALGASRARVTGLVVRESLIPVAMGLAVGVAAALALTRILSSLLFRVAPSDPLAIIGPVLLILVGAGLAAWIPARRAARVEPATSLRG
jgi:predicted permease